MNKIKIRRLKWIQNNLKGWILHFSPKKKNVYDCHLSKFNLKTTKKNSKFFFWVNSKINLKGKLIVTI